VIANLKPYVDYKHSGLPWLAQVPAHWGQRRMKFLFKERVQKGFPDEPLLAATQSKGVVLKEDYGSRTVTATKDFHLLKLVEPGDFVVSLRSFEGGLELAHCRGIISPAYTVLRPSREVSEAYYARLFKSSAFISSLTLFVTGIREGQNIDYERLSRAYMPLPPADEQEAIGRFLAWTNGRLEHAIRAKRKVITLLMEQRQAVIHRAVTQGLDPTAPLRPTGVPWLGDIPAHWELWRVSRFAQVGNGSTPSRAKPNYWNGGTYPWLNSSQVNRQFIASADQFVTSIALRECHLPRVPAGSVLVAITGQGKTRGTSAILGVEATINQHIAFITPRIPIASPEYIHLALTAAYSQLRAASEDAGSTKGAITCEDLKRFKLAIPPPAEQAQLVRHIQMATGRLTIVITRLEREIGLLREYRTRLTADIVTGKLDVREAASRLPDEPTLELIEDVTGAADEPEIADEEATA
jgi:type I restriction enzyme, S subunit